VDGDHRGRSEEKGGGRWQRRTWCAGFREGCKGLESGVSLAARSLPVPGKTYDGILPRLGSTKCFQYRNINLTMKADWQQPLMAAALSAVYPQREPPTLNLKWMKIVEDEAKKKAEEFQLEQNVPIEGKREDGKGHRGESGISLAARSLPVPGKDDRWQNVASRAIQKDCELRHRPFKDPKVCAHALFNFESWMRREYSYLPARLIVEFENDITLMMKYHHFGSGNLI
jgi:hypothetical protein